MADVFIAQTLQWIKSGVLDGVPPELLDAFPALMRTKAGVDEHPTLLAWHAAHPLPN